MLTKNLPEPPPSSPDMPEGAIDRQFAIVTLDYERTVELLGGVANARMALRTFLATAYVTLLGLAFEQHSTALGIAAAASGALGATNDLYLGWVYHEALQRANQLERLFQHRVQALDRPYDPYPAERLRVELERYDFGVYATFPRFQIHRVGPSLRWALVGIYVIAIVGAVIAGLLAG